MNEYMATKLSAVIAAQPEVHARLRCRLAGSGACARGTCTSHLVSHITLLEKLLVREKNRVLVEYALGNSAQPISVAEWETQLTRALPKELQGSLPTIEEIEAELSGDASVASGGGDE